MASAAKRARTAPPSRRMLGRGAATNFLGLIGLISAAAVYWFLFLRMPLGAGMVDDDGRAISRGGLMLSTLLLPENLVAAWFDGGRLPSAFLDRGPLAIATLLWLGLATLVGLPSVGAWLPEFQAKSMRGRLERFSLAALVGLALLSTLTLLVGLAGGLASRWPLVALCTTAAIVAMLAMVTLPRRARASDPSLAAEPTSTCLSLEAGRTRELSVNMFDRGLSLIAAGLTCWLSIVTMLGAWVPSAEFDVMEYHLQAPKEFFQLGAIRFLPHNIYANMPLGAEMHSLAMMTLVGQPDAWWGGLMGKSITASITLLSAGLLGAYVARRLGTTSGWSAAGIWLASPGIAQSAMLGLIDGVLAGYVLAAAVAVMNALKAADELRRISDSRDGRWLVLRRRLIHCWWLSGVLAGAAAATKYPGLHFAVIPVCCAFAWVAYCAQRANRSRSSPQENQVARRTRGHALVVMLLGFAVTCGAWYGKNWILADNPVYPLAANLFGGRTLTPEKIEQWRRAHRVPASFAPGAAGAERLLASLRTAGRDFLRLTLTSPFVQPAMICGLAIAVGAVLMRRTRRNHLQTLRAHEESEIEWQVWLAWSLWIAAVWWFATHRIDRFWLPLTGLWAGLSAFGLHRLRGRVSPWLAHAILIMGLGYGSLLCSTSLVSDSRYFVSLAALRDDVGDENQVARITQEQAWINQHLPAEDNVRVLMVGEARVFEYRVPILYSTCFDINPGEALLKARPPAQQLAGLHERGITHVMINWSEIGRYRSAGNYGFSDWPQRADVEEMLREGVVTQVQWGIPETMATLLRVE